MLKTLIQHGGQAAIREVAIAFLTQDESQIEYYEQITKEMPGRVLRNHGILERRDKEYVLLEQFAGLSASEKNEVMALCDAAIEDYKAKRGRAIWQHRTNTLGYIPGGVRYTVLKRAGFKCELCGVSADERRLEVDHIIPRKYQGSDDPENLQALCWVDNANKGASDATDFRKLRESYDCRESDCIFCDVPEQRIMNSNSLAFSTRDQYPVSPLHTLIIPKRHSSDFFSLHGGERNAIFALLNSAKEEIQSQDKSVEGFNVGINNGEVAGQTIYHTHIHLIPRRQGDVTNPRGGVRAIIAAKATH